MFIVPHLLDSFVISFMDSYTLGKHRRFYEDNIETWENAYDYYEVKTAN